MQYNSVHSNGAAFLTCHNSIWGAFSVLSVQGKCIWRSLHGEQ